MRYRTLVTGTAASVVGRGLAALYALVLATLLFRHLGADRYGLWSFAAVLVGPQAILDFGLGSTLERVVGRAQAMGDRAAIGGAVGSGALIATGVALAVGALAWAAGTSLDLGADVMSLAVALPACLWCAHLAAVLSGAVAGCQRLILVNVIRSVTGAMALALVAVLVLALDVRSPGWLLAAYASGRLLTVIWCVAALRPELGPSLHSLAPARSMLVEEFLVIGGKVQLSALLPQVADQTVRAVLGARFGPSVMGFYDLGSRAAAAIRTLAGALFTTLVPFSARAAAVDGVESLGSVHRLSVKFTAIWVLVATAIALLLSERIVSLWLGSDDLPVIVWVFRVFLISNALTALAAPAMMIGRGTGVVSSEMAAAMATVSLATAFSLTLPSSRLVALAVGAAFAAPPVVASLYLVRRIGLEVPDARTIAGILLAAGSGVLVAATVTGVLPARSPASLIVSVMLSAAVGLLTSCVALAAAGVVSRDERAALGTLWPKSR